MKALVAERAGAVNPAGAANAPAEGGSDPGFFHREIEILGELLPAKIFGRITQVVGMIAESHGLAAPIGAQCEIIGRRGNRITAEVVGFREENAIIVPYGDIRGVAAGDRVYFCGDVPRIKATTDMIGRIFNSSGQPIDERYSMPAERQNGRSGGGTAHIPRASRRMPIHGSSINPMHRRRIERPLPTGIRVIDGLFTVGRGQRLGIFSGSGVGKSTLLAMIARNAYAPVSVIALIGERGREVREFVERDLGPDGLRRSVLVVATSDEPALRRLQAAFIATAIAEFFRDLGLEVILLLDSITRVAMAQREIGLSAGEPPATRGYPPSVFAMLPKLLERSGPGVQGSITAFYSVLVEGDDIHDPVGDAVRGILDGHLWLSREMAGRSFFPAVDPLLSISRSMSDVALPDHYEAARKAIFLISKYREVEDLLQLGAYTPGTDPKVDEAVQAMPAIEKLLRQDRIEVSSFEHTVHGLKESVRPKLKAVEKPAAKVAAARVVGGRRP